jgi:hypothetical protein
MTTFAALSEMPPASAVEFSAAAPMQPAPLAELLSAAILSCGGWILERHEPRPGWLSVLMEFECERSMEIYFAVIALGIQLSRKAHLSLTGLCQCARHAACLRCLPVARVRMTVQTGADCPTAELANTQPCGW